MTTWPDDSTARHPDTDQLPAGLRLLALVAILVAAAVVAGACGGGGRSTTASAPATPPLATTHPWLAGLWVGSIYVNGETVSTMAFLELTQDDLATDVADARLVTDFGEFGFLSEEFALSAFGETVTATCGSATFTGPAYPFGLMDLGWVITSGDPALLGISGRATLNRTGIPN